MAYPKKFIQKVQLALLLPMALLFGGEGQAKHPEKQPIRVQLLWKHQAQFSGLYVAQERDYFKEQGIDVEYRLGGPGINPIKELQSGHADIAFSWLENAMALSKENKRVVNVAQIFSKSSLLLVCKTSAGVYSAKDLRGKTIGVWYLGDEHIVREIVRRSGVSQGSVKITRQRPDGADLIDGTLPCVTAMEYNEYWKILSSGFSYRQLTIIRPEQFGIPHIEDGVYVMAERLEDPLFQEQLVRFLGGLRKGWAESREAPTLALDTVGRLDPSLNPDHQRHMLESVLGSIAEDKPFGLFNLSDYEQVLKTQGTESLRKHEKNAIWTHRIWDRMDADFPDETGNGVKPGFGKNAFNNSTIHYLKSVFNSKIYALVVLLATLLFAMSAALQAIDLGYGPWGRLVVAMAAALGGGSIRDLLIGGDRLPFYFMSQWEYPVGIFMAVVVATAISKRPKSTSENSVMPAMRYWSENIGNSAIAVNGAFVAIIAQLPWYWAPFCAALSVTGGGLLKDILTNREPSAFQGLMVEEAAIVVGLFLLLVLGIANYYEHSAIPVYFATCAGFILAMLLLNWISNRQKSVSI